MSHSIELLHVELVFATPDRQELIELRVPAGSSVMDVVRSSGVASGFPEQDFAGCRTGIWGREVSEDHVVAEGDRVELYRPLEKDPREARRSLAAEGRSMGQKRDDGVAS